MKKTIVLLLVFSLCLSLAACGGTGNPDHDYVLALMEQGDYESHMMFNTDCVWSSDGILEPFTEEEIQIINEVLIQK